MTICSGVTRKCAISPEIWPGFLSLRFMQPMQVKGVVASWQNSAAVLKDILAIPDATSYTVSALVVSSSRTA